MASFSLMRHKILINSSFTCKFLLTYVISPSQGNLEKDFQIELFDTDLLGVFLGHMETSNQTKGDENLSVFVHLD